VEVMKEDPVPTIIRVGDAGAEVYHGIRIDCVHSTGTGLGRDHAEEAEARADVEHVISRANRGTECAGIRRDTRLVRDHPEIVRYRVHAELRAAAVCAPAIHVSSASTRHAAITASGRPTRSVLIHSPWSIHAASLPPGIGTA